MMVTYDGSPLRQLHVVVDTQKYLKISGDFANKRIELEQKEGRYDARGQSDLTKKFEDIHHGTMAEWAVFEVGTYYGLVDPRYPPDCEIYPNHTRPDGSSVGHDPDLRLTGGEGLWVKSSPSRFRSPRDTLCCSWTFEKSSLRRGSGYTALVELLNTDKKQWSLRGAYFGPTIDLMKNDCFEPPILNRPTKVAVYADHPFLQGN